MKARPPLWNLRPLGQPSYCTTRSHSCCGEMRKMRPNGMSTIQRLPSRSNDGPSRKHSTSAPWRFGSDQAVRRLLRNCVGMDVNTSALISSSGLNGLSMDAASSLCLGIASTLMAHSVFVKGVLVWLWPFQNCKDDAGSRNAQYHPLTSVPTGQLLRY